jgi:hypothetical protein
MMTTKFYEYRCGAVTLENAPQLIQEMLNADIVAINVMGYLQ